MLKKLRARLQSLKTEREEAKHREEMALRGKDAVRCQAFVPGCKGFLRQDPAGTQIHLRQRWVVSELPALGNNELN